MAAQSYYVDPQQARDFASSILQQLGLPIEDAIVMAGCLIQADLRGVGSHGLARLDQYIGRIRSGLVNVKPDIRVSDKTPAVAELDGDNGFGFIVSTRGMKEAIARADVYGIAIVTVKHSNHFGMAASYVLQAIAAGMVSFVFSNSAKNMPAFGSKETLFGTSPFAAGAPAQDEVPFVLDMAPSVVAKGKIRAAARRGQSIPEGWATDEDGRPTTDPNEAIKGMVVPIGGPKGSGIAMLMDIMSGVLSGSAFAGGVGDQYKDQRPQDVGHCFIVIKPDLFLSPGDVRLRMDELIRKVHGSLPAKGFNEVLVPGEPEYRLSLKRAKEGIPFADVERQMFKKAAAEFKVPELDFSEAPLSLQ